MMPDSAVLDRDAFSLDVAPADSREVRFEETLAGRAWLLFIATAVGAAALAFAWVVIGDVFEVLSWCVVSARDAIVASVAELERWMMAAVGIR